MAEHGEAQHAAAPPAVEVQHPPKMDDESALSDRDDNVSHLSLSLHRGGGEHSPAICVCRPPSTKRPQVAQHHPRRSKLSSLSTVANTMAFPQDTFEDAVDARSVRSLTKRSSSAHKPAPAPSFKDVVSESESDSELESEAEAETEVKTEAVPEKPTSAVVPEKSMSDVVPEPEPEKAQVNGDSGVHGLDVHDSDVHDDEAPAPPAKDVEAVVEDDLHEDSNREPSFISTNGTLDEVKLDDVKLDDVKLDDVKLDEEAASPAKGILHYSDCLPSTCR